MLYLVSIDCTDDRLKKFETCVTGLSSDIFPVQNGVWVIQADKPAVELRSRIKEHLQKDETALVALLAGHAAWAGFGPQARGWLLKNL